jgi:tetrahydromethanopterin S-methyltransferase subunit G
MVDEHATGGDSGSNSHDVPDAYTRVAIEDWEELERRLREVEGSVETVDGVIQLRSGDAQFTVTREGDIDTGMPLHAFEREGVEALYVDADRDRIRVYGPEGVAYEFRSP